MDHRGQAADEIQLCQKDITWAMNRSELWAAKRTTSYSSAASSTRPSRMAPPTGPGHQDDFSGDKASDRENVCEHDLAGDPPPPARTVRSMASNVIHRVFS